jgi:hypothetical protein
MQRVKATYGERPFEGLGLFGYDEGRRTWTRAWIDVTSTGIPCADGEEKEKGRVWEFRASFVGPSGPSSARDRHPHVGPDELRLETWLGDAKDPTMTRTCRGA